MATTPGSWPTEATVLEPSVTKQNNMRPTLKEGRVGWVSGRLYGSGVACSISLGPEVMICTFPGLMSMERKL